MGNPWDTHGYRVDPPPVSYGWSMGGVLANDLPIVGVPCVDHALPMEMGKRLMLR